MYLPRLLKGKAAPKNNYNKDIIFILLPPPPLPSFLSFSLSSFPFLNTSPAFSSFPFSSLFPSFFPSFPPFSFSFLFSPPPRPKYMQTKGDQLQSHSEFINSK